MWAVIEVSKKQYKVKEGEIIEVERLSPRNPLVLDKVLVYCQGDDIRIGRPYLENFTVKAEVLREEKSDKIIVYKCKRRKKYRKKIGHRQIHSRLKILQITGK